MAAPTAHPAASTNRGYPPTISSALSKSRQDLGSPPLLHMNHLSWSGPHGDNSHKTCKSPASPPALPAAREDTCSRRAPWVLSLRHCDSLATVLRRGPDEALKTPARLALRFHSPQPAAWPWRPAARTDTQTHGVSSTRRPRSCGNKCPHTPGANNVSPALGLGDSGPKREEPPQWHRLSPGGARAGPKAQVWDPEPRTRAPTSPPKASHAVQPAAPRPGPATLKGQQRAGRRGAEPTNRARGARLALSSAHSPLPPRSPARLGRAAPGEGHRRPPGGPEHATPAGLRAWSLTRRPLPTAGPPARRCTTAVRRTRVCQTKLLFTRHGLPSSP